MRDNEAGFSLLEILVVLSIMSIMLSVVGARLVQNIESTYFHQTADSVLGDILLIRVEASLNHEPRIIVASDADFRQNPERYNGFVRQLNLPQGWSMAGGPIEVTPTGMCLGGEVSLLNEKGRSVTYELSAPKCERSKVS